MASVISFLGPIISLVSSVIGGGPYAWVFSGVGLLGLLAGGIFLFNKFKNAQFDHAQNSGNEQGTVDIGHVITDNQHQGSDDEVSEAQSEKDKINAINDLNKPR